MSGEDGGRGQASVPTLDDRTAARLKRELGNQTNGLGCVQ